MILKILIVFVENTGILKDQVNVFDTKNLALKNFILVNGDNFLVIDPKVMIREHDFVVKVSTVVIDQMCYILDFIVGQITYIGIIRF